MSVTYGKDSFPTTEDFYERIVCARKELVPILVDVLLKARSVICHVCYVILRKVAGDVFQSA